MAWDFDWGRFLTGVGGGALAGSTLGPWGALGGGLLGGLGGFWAPEKPVAPNIHSPMYQMGDNNKEIDAWIQNSIGSLQQKAGKEFTNTFNQYMGSVGQRGLYNTSAPAEGGQKIGDAIQQNLAGAMADVMGQGAMMKQNAWNQGMGRYSDAYQTYLQQLNAQPSGGMDINSLISLLINKGK